MQFDKLEDLVGKRLLHNILDSRGLLLIPDGTVLTENHVRKMEDFNIKAYDIQVELVTIVEEIHQSDIDDIEPEKTTLLQVTASDSRELVQKTKAQIYEIENFILNNGKVPIGDISEKVLPTLMEATNKRNVFRFLSDLKAEGDYRYKQSIGVTVVATMLGKWLQLDEENLTLLTTAASLYDIGSLKIPSSLLHKPSSLQPDEYEIVKQHTILGYQLLKESDIDDRIALVALQHHERENGSGYPNQLKGDQIDLLSKIVALADVFFAMISERPYRPAIAFYKVIDDLHKGIINGQFDSYIGFTFLNRLMSAQVGNDVILSDGRKGKIILVNVNDPTSPLIAVENEFIDLSKINSIKIREIVG